MTEKEIKQLQNKRKKLIRQQKQEERKKRGRRFYEKGAFFESIFFERKDFSKDEFYQLITSLNSREEIYYPFLKILSVTMQIITVQVQKNILKAIGSLKEKNSAALCELKESRGY